MAFTDHMQRNRFELKYIIDERQARGVRDFMRSYLVRDRFARPELAFAYTIYSVYLDSPGLALFNATVQGHKNRFKLRARYYDGKPNGPVFFEIKRRVNDVILKDRAPVRRPAVARLLMGAPPRREDLQDPGDPEAWSALRQFCDLRTSIGAVGRNIVAYTREAWNAKDNDDVRVTFDRRIAGSWYDGSLPINEALRIDRRWVFPPVGVGEIVGIAPAEVPPRNAPDHNVVLELKFTGCYPRWMESLAATFDLYRTCMAKYVGCVYALGPVNRGLRVERLAGRQQRRERLI